MRPVGSPDNALWRGGYQGSRHLVAATALRVGHDPIGACQFDPAMRGPRELCEPREILAGGAVLLLHVAKMVDAEINIERSKAVDEARDHAARRIKLEVPTYV